MAQLATCPFCTTQLALPDGASLSDRARCPRCAQEFLLMETVQFSIPTAEILPPAAEEETTPLAPETASDMLESTGAQPFFPEPLTREDTSETVEPPQNLEPELSPVAPMLSDWESRLRRAMADDVDEVTQTGTVFPTTEPSDAATSQPPETFQPRATHDFSIPETDLVPEKEPHPAARSLDDWSPEEYSPESYIDDQDRTVTTTGDQTVSDYRREDEAQEVNVVAEIAPRKKRKRGLLRTLASASLGVIGIPIGLYILLWLRGPAGDVLHVAQYVPSFMLPTSFAGLEVADSSDSEEVARVPAESTPVESTDTLVQNDEENPASEETPSMVHDSAVAPASAETPVYHGPTFELVTGEEFAELLAAAEAAAPLLAEGELKANVASKGQAYMALARLAEKSSFLYQPELTTPEITKALLAKQLFESTMREENVKRDLPQIALRWWQYNERPSSGMIFTGRVERVQRTEAGVIAYVSLDTEPIAPEIPVLMPGALHREGEFIGVVGSIVTDPSERLPAIDGSPGPILIAHYTFPLQQPTAPEADPQL